MAAILSHLQKAYTQKSKADQKTVNSGVSVLPEVVASKGVALDLSTNGTGNYMDDNFERY